MSQTTLVGEGAFQSEHRVALNDMFTELYAASAAGVNASATVALPKTSTGVTTLMAAATVARQVIISVQVTEVFANGDGAQPTFSIGETGAATKFAATARFTAAAAGATFSFAGTLTAATALIITAVAATGTTSTGALAVTAIASV